VPALILTGVFVSAATPAGGKFVLRAFPRTNRALALGVRQTGTPLGGLIAAAALPVIASQWGWRTALIAGGVVAAFAAALVVPLGGPTYPRERSEATKAVGATFRSFLRDRDVGRLTIWAAVMVSSQYALVAFLALDASGRARISLPHAVLL